MFKLVES